MKSQSDLKKKKTSQGPKGRVTNMSRVGARKAVSPIKDLEELPHNMHHFVICSTPPVSSRGLLAFWPSGPV